MTLYQLHRLYNVDGKFSEFEELARLGDVKQHCISCRGFLELNVMRQNQYVRCFGMYRAGISCHLLQHLFRETG
jgi:hypothetical protein